MRSRRWRARSDRHRHRAFDGGDRGRRAGTARAGHGSRAPAASETPPAAVGDPVPVRRDRSIASTLALVGLGAILAGGSTYLLVRGVGTETAAPVAAVDRSNDARRPAVAAIIPPPDAPDAARAVVPDALATPPDAGPSDARTPDPGRTGRSGRLVAAAPPANQGSGSAARTKPVEDPSIRRKVTVNSTPWSYFTVDGDPSQHQTVETIELTPGAHRLRFNNPAAGLTREVTIEVPADRDFKYVANLNE